MISGFTGLSIAPGLDRRVVRGGITFSPAGRRTSMTAVANLTVSTPTDREIVMTRVFDAPRTRVYDAFVTPSLLREWLAVRGMTMTVTDSDNRVGGRYRFEATLPGGHSLGWGGEFREIVPNELLVQTEAFDGYPGEALNTTTFEEGDGKTTVTIRLEYPSKEIRDIVLGTGMPDGAGEAYDNLQELLRKS
jgi:uncharacterized protein YndB with AHSA1/START domain